jgi:cyclopropane fatty-acyl-phospholipid synthase-like methyltransferase
MIALTIAAYAIGIVIIACGSAILISMQIARKSAAPYFPSTKRALRLAMQEAHLAPGETFYDLGAGTGASLVIASNEFGARAVGSEISILPYLIAKLRIVLTGARHASVRFEDLFAQDVHDADVVFCFLAERILPRIVEKLRRELRPGARIVSHAFALPGMTPTAIIAPREDAWKIYVYTIGHDQ